MGAFKIHQCLLNLDIEKIVQGRLEYRYWSKVPDSSNNEYKCVSINDEHGKISCAHSPTATLPEEIAKLGAENARDRSRIVVHTDLDWMLTSKANECFVLTPKLPKWTGAGESTQIKQVSFRIKSEYDRAAHQPFFTCKPDSFAVLVFF